MSKLAGKVAVVTGASKGLGAAIARTFGAAGASIVVNYASSKDGAEKVVAEITGAGGKAIAVQGDVSKAADIESLFAATKKEFGKVDVLVNNAGVYQFSSLEQVTEAELQRQFGTNVFGLILATQAALPLFGQDGGSVINIGSAVSRVAPPQSVIYTATKSAVDGITNVLAKDLGPRKIRVNSINPGMVETEGVHSAGFIGSDFATQLIGQTPLGRMGQPQDIADIALFLASTDSGWLTGETIIASGGMK